MATDAEKNITATDTKNPEQQEFDKLEQNLTNTIEPISEDTNSNSKFRKNSDRDEYIRCIQRFV